MTTQSPPGTPTQPGTTISLSLVPSVLAWSDAAADSGTSSKTRLSADPGGRFLAVSTADDYVLLDLKTGMHIVAEFDETGATLTIVDLDAFVTVINTASANQISRTALRDAHIVNPPLSLWLGCPVALSPDRQIVIVAERDSNSMYAAAPSALLMHAVVPVTQIASGPGRSVAVVTQDGLVRVIDLDLQAELARIYSNAPVNDIAIDTAAGLLASGSDDGTLRVDTWGNQ